MDERLTSVEDPLAGDEAAGNETRGDEAAKHDGAVSDVAPKGKAEIEGSAVAATEGERLMAVRFTGDTIEALQLKLARNESYVRGIDTAEHTLAVIRLVIEDLPEAQRATPYALFKELDEIEDPEAYREKAEEIEKAMHVCVSALRYPESILRDDAALPGIKSRDLRTLPKLYPDIAGYDGMEVCEYLLRTYVEERARMTKEKRDDPVDIPFSSMAKKLFGDMGRSETAGRTPLANMCVFKMRHRHIEMFVGTGPTARPLSGGADAVALEDAEMEAVADTGVADGGDRKRRPISYTIRVTPKGLAWLIERKERARTRKAPFVDRIKELERKMAEYEPIPPTPPRFGLARRLAATVAVVAVLAALGMPEISGWMANDVMQLAGPNSALGDGRPLIL